jgi:hypothetical protein
MDIYNKIKDWFYNSNKKNIIIDPIACLIKLSILSLYPKGTKVSVTKNGMTFSDLTMFQGTIRFFQGDCREDLHNIFKPIQKAIDWYWCSKTYEKELEVLFHMSEEGLFNLKYCYEDNSTIQHSLDYYIAYLKNKDNIENEEDEDSNVIYDYLQNLWTKREINIIIQFFQEYKDKDNQEEKENIILNINNMTNTKEKLLADFIKQQSSTL